MSYRDDGLIGAALRAPEPFVIEKIAARRVELAEIFRPRPIALAVRRIVGPRRLPPLQNERIVLGPGEHA